MSETRLVSAALKVIAAWHDYVSDGDQIMPAMLCDTDILDELCAAVSEATGKTITRHPAIALASTPSEATHA